MEMRQSRKYFVSLVTRSIWLSRISMWYFTSFCWGRLGLVLALHQQLCGEKHKLNCTVTNYIGYIEHSKPSKCLEMPLACDLVTHQCILTHTWDAPVGDLTSHTSEGIAYLIFLLSPVPSAHTSPKERKNFFRLIHSYRFSTKITCRIHKSVGLVARMQLS